MTVTNPEYYKRGGKDLIQQWSERYTAPQFVAVMESHIDKYLYRHDKKNGIEDLDKAIEYIKRLKEWESGVHRGDA